MSESAPAVLVHDLVKEYSGRAVVAGVSFDVARGEVFPLLGPNGAGKTTTVEVVAGYRQADAGEVRVLRVDPWRASPSLRARVGLMLQNGGMEPRARPDEILRLYAAFHARPRDPDDLIDLVGLRGVAGTRYRRLSGGERQRLAFAVALVGRPELLILDEPTAGMDPGARSSTRELIRGLRSDGAGVLLTTHDLVDVERLADRVAIIDAGRIVGIGTPAELVAAAGPRLALRFEKPLEMGELASLAAMVRRGRKGVTVRGELGDRSTAFIEGVMPDPGLVAAVTRWAAARGVLITELRAAGRTLEDRYLELTGQTAVATDDVA
ncbi:MAG: ABC transporter ATP-binding protein [Chloroflexi bacterium]|nr:MAG: ABC transporter ATP-binding protein [Chloroflexota bacterium]